MNDLIAYMNGAYLPADEVVVSPFDHGFLYGDGCFEGIVVVGGQVLHLQEHVDRFVASLKYLRIDLGLTAEGIADAILGTASRNGLDTPDSVGYLRPVATRGVGPMGVSQSLNLTPTILVLPQIGERTIGFDAEDIDVLDAVVTQYTSYPASSLDPAVKANQYIPNVLAFLQAKASGAEVGLLRDTAGAITEGYGMNVFAVRDGVVVTPSEEVALRGITRRYAIDVVRQLGYTVENRSLYPYDLVTADEIFVTASMHSVAAVTKVDGVSIGDGSVGPITQAVRSGYLDFAAKTGTPVPALSTLVGK